MKKMTKQEAMDFIKNSEDYAQESWEMDSCTNELETCIIKNNNKLYRVGYTNGELNNVLGKKDEYEFHEVIEKKRIIEQTYYECLECEQKKENDKRNK